MDEVVNELREYIQRFEKAANMYKQSFEEASLRQVECQAGISRYENLISQYKLAIEKLTNGK